MHNPCIWPATHTPDNIGAFRILGILGQGGMGVVYKATHQDTGQAVALKMAPQPGAGRMAALRREIQSLAGLHHPGIAPILDEGLHKGLPWYAMQLLEGQPLRAMIPHKQQPDIGRVTTLIARFCAPLAFLHGEGLAHRDLKPDNVLIQPDGRPVLIDFGLAARFSDTSKSRETLQTDALGAGTFLYMAPEQAEGEIVDARADLYSLGCILYELLTGQPPFTGKSAAELLYQHAYTEALPPSCAAPGIPPELDSVVLRLLAKQAKHRFGYASDVMRALSPWTGSLPHEDGPTARVYLYRPSLAGREDVISQLQQHTLQAFEQQRGCMLLLAGESGSGKTHLATELARRLRMAASPRIWTGEAQEQAREPLHLFSKLLREIADFCQEGGLPATEKILGKRGKTLALYSQALAGLPGQADYPEPAELPAREAQLRLFLALAETLLVFVGNTPAFLILDDLHWADDLTLQFLAFLQKTKAIEKMPLVILGTYRSEEQTEFLAKMASSPAVLHAPLTRLTSDSVGSMAADMLALGAVPEVFSRFLTKTSEGNPFYAAEYLRIMLEPAPDGSPPLLFRDEDGYWRVAGKEKRHLTEAAYDQLALPASLRDLTTRRLAQLSPEARSLAEAASVLGLQFEVSLLEAVSGMPASQIGVSLRELIRRHLLQEERGDSLRFSHAKLRDAAYSSLEPGPRQELHRAAALALEAHAQTEAEGDTSAALARHWQGAGELRRALPYLQTAATFAERAAAAKEALAFHQQALAAVEALSPTDPSLLPLQFDLLHHCQDAYTLLGRLEDALSMAKRMEQAAIQQGDQAMQARAWRNQGVVLMNQGRYADSLALYGKAIQQFESLDETKFLAGTLENRMQSLLALGRLQEALADGERAMHLLEFPRDWKSAGMVQQLQAAIRYQENNPKACQTLMEQALESFKKAGSTSNALLCEMNIGALALFEGRYSEADRILSQTARQARENELWMILLSCLQNLGFLQQELGMYEQAQKNLQEACLLALETGDLDWGLKSFQVLGRIFLLEQKWDLAKQTFQQGLTFVGQDPSNSRDSLLHSGLFLCQALQASYPEAVAAIEQEFLRLGIETQPEDRLTVLLDRMQAWIQTEHHSEDPVWWERTEKLLQETGRLDLRFRAYSLRTLALARLGKAEKSKQATQQAQQVLTQIEAYLEPEHLASFRARPDIQAFTSAPLDERGSEGINERSVAGRA